MHTESIHRRLGSLLSSMTIGALMGCASAAPKPATVSAAPAPRAAAHEQTPSKEDHEPTLGGELPAPAHFPAEAREMMRARMIRHGESMTFLMAGVIFLAYDDVQSIAFDIAKEPKLGRPAAGETDTLNALLPMLFFDLQDELSARARQVALAAEARDSSRLVATFGTLAETCVACHAAYLADDEAEGADALAAH